MQRSYAVAASIELDAVVVVGAVPPAPDARTTVDAKAGAAQSPADPRVAKILTEAWRHSKAIGVVGDGEEVLAAADVPVDGTAVVVGEAAAVAAGVLELLAAHRAWGRFTPVSAT